MHVLSTILTATSLLTLATSVRIPPVRKEASTNIPSASGGHNVRWIDSDKANPAPRDLPDSKLWARFIGAGGRFARDADAPDGSPGTAAAPMARGTGGLAGAVSTTAPYPMTTTDATEGSDPTATDALGPTATDGSEPTPTDSVEPPERVRRATGPAATVAAVAPSPKVSARQASLILTAGGLSSISISSTASAGEAPNAATSTKTVYVTATPSSSGSTPSTSGVSYQMPYSSSNMNAIKAEVSADVFEAMEVKATESTFVTTTTSTVQCAPESVHSAEPGNVSRGQGVSDQVPSPACITITSSSSTSASGEKSTSSVSDNAARAPTSDGKTTEIVITAATATAKSGVGKLSPWW